MNDTVRIKRLYNTVQKHRLSHVRAQMNLSRAPNLLQDYDPSTSHYKWVLILKK